MSIKTKKECRDRRHRRIRGKIRGTANCPRLAVFVSGRHMYVQMIDDDSGRTLVSASTLAADFKATGKKPNVAGAAALGTLAAEKAKAAALTQAVFDRGGFRYHGRVKAIAEAARAAGIKI